MTSEVKTCNTCGATKSLEEFCKNKRLKDGRSGHCKACARVRAKAFREANPDKVRETRRKGKAKHGTYGWHAKRYGLTVEQYDNMLARQGGVCAICRQPETAVKNGAVRRLSVDHDHTCCPEGPRSCGQCVRGLLCSRCNIGIGQFNEDGDRLLAALAYLTNESRETWQTLIPSSSPALTTSCLDWSPAS